jgi:hypothetical protein
VGDEPFAVEDVQSEGGRPLEVQRVVLGPLLGKHQLTGHQQRRGNKGREAVLPEHEYNSPTGKRVYDLRHTCLTIWLNKGVPPAQVAERAGNSVPVLLATYARCITGRLAALQQRIEGPQRLPAGFSKHAACYAWFLTHTASPCLIQRTAQTSASASGHRRSVGDVDPVPPREGIEAVVVALPDGAQAPDRAPAVDLREEHGAFGCRGVQGGPGEG